MKNTLKGINSRKDEAENQIGNLEDKEAENGQSKSKKSKESSTVRAVRSLWDNFKHSNIHIMGKPDGEKRE